MCASVGGRSSHQVRGWHEAVLLREENAGADFKQGGMLAQCVGCCAVLQSQTLWNVITNEAANKQELHSGMKGSVRSGDLFRLGYIVLNRLREHVAHVRGSWSDHNLMIFGLNGIRIVCE